MQRWRPGRPAGQRRAGEVRARPARRPPAPVAGLTAASLLLAAALAGCADQSGTAEQASSTTPAVARPSTTGRPPAASTTDVPLPTAPGTAADPSLSVPVAWPAFEWSVEPVTADRLGTTWRPECPVPPSELRLVSVTYASFGGGPATGEIIVNQAVADRVVAAFGELYAARFPIRKMITMDAYAGDDLRAGIEDNTSGFNCRPVLGTDRWSQHAYGLAVDLNPLENPYLVGDEIRPPAGAAYLDRTDVRPGMIVEGDVVYRAFTARGFEWGGFFVTTPDYQHFALPR